MSDWVDRSPYRRSDSPGDYGADWERRRKIVLERDCYLCQCSHCKADKLTRLATEVDHVVSKERAYAQGWTRDQVEDLSNLQAINKDCHKRKTQEERGKTYKPKRKIGLDGFPV